MVFLEVKVFVCPKQKVVVAYSKSRLNFQGTTRVALNGIAGRAFANLNDIRLVVLVDWENCFITAQRASAGLQELWPVLVDHCNIPMQNTLWIICLDTDNPMKRQSVENAVIDGMSIQIIASEGFGEADQLLLGLGEILLQRLEGGNAAGNANLRVVILSGDTFGDHRMGHVEFIHILEPNGAIYQNVLMPLATERGWNVPPMGLGVSRSQHPNFSPLPLHPNNLAVCSGENCPSDPEHPEFQGLPDSVSNHFQGRGIAPSVNLPDVGRVLWGTAEFHGESRRMRSFPNDAESGRCLFCGEETTLISRPFPTLLLRSSNFRFDDSIEVAWPLIQGEILELSNRTFGIGKDESAQVFIELTNPGTGIGRQFILSTQWSVEVAESSGFRLEQGGGRVTIENGNAVVNGIIDHVPRAELANGTVRIITPEGNFLVRLLLNR